MDKIGWKVVNRYYTGSLRSAVAIGTWSRTYAIGERTVGRDGTPVLAFRTRQAARDFYAHTALSNLRVFKAELDNPRPQDRISEPFIQMDYAAFWAGVEVGSMLAPYGTLACDAITLLERA